MAAMRLHCLTAAILLIVLSGHGQTPPPAPAAWHERYSNLPLSFEQNRGQAPRQVKFLAHGRGSTLLLTSNEARLQLAESKVPLRFTFPGAKRSPVMAGLDPQPGRSNYFLGRDASQWRTAIAHYSRVEYRDLYPGVDLVYYGRNRQLEYDFVVRAGADPGKIRLNVKGCDRLTLDPSGDLLLATGGAEIRLHRPIAYQEQPSGRTEVSAQFTLRGHTASLALGSYDRSRTVIVDPVLTYSTYFGAGSDFGNGIAVDAAGNIYVTGTTSAANFPLAGAIQSAIGYLQVGFVAKLNPTGTTLLYSTYLGGSGGDDSRAIAVDGQGNAYVTGVTHSKDFPVRNALQPVSASGWSVFAAKLSADGSQLVYSTYLGGTSLDEGWGIAVDSSGNAYVTGQALSRDFPTVNAIQPLHSGNSQACSQGYCDNDVFVSMIRADGQALVYSTFLGGTGTDIGYAIAVDSSGNVSVTGSTISTYFPTANAVQTTLHSKAGAFSPDAFVARLSPGGKALIFSTYFGGAQDDAGRGIAVDQTGASYITGGTNSADFPVAAALQPTFGGGPTAFVSKFSPNGSIVYSTYLGGTSPSVLFLNQGSGDSGNAIAVDAAGNAYVAGSTSTTDFPSVQPLSQARLKGVYRSTDGAATWSGSNAGLKGQFRGTGSLQIDPRNPSTLYAGTVAGVFKSIDGGVHWNATGLTSSTPFLAVDPSNSSLIYASTTTGFAKSTDGGTTWTMPFGTKSYGTSAIPPVAAVANSAGAVTVYLGATRSTDGGVTWSTPNFTGVNAGPCDSPSSCVSISVSSLAVDPSAPSSSFAGITQYSIGPIPMINSPLFKSVNGGSYAPSSKGLPFSVLAGIAVDPHDSTRVFAAGSSGVFRSTDSGATWAATSETVEATSLLIDPTNSSLIYAGSVQGVLKSTDGGNTWAVTGLTSTTGTALALETGAPQSLYAIGNSGMDGFVTELNAAGNAILFSSTLNGADTDLGNAIAVDPSGSIYVAGSTLSVDFPTVGAFQPYFPNYVLSRETAFISKIGCAVPEPSLKVTLPVGFYITEVINAPETAAGDWGLSVQPSQGVLDSNLSFGGGLEENGTAPAYTAFRIAQPANVSLNLRAETLSGAPLPVTARVLDQNRQEIGVDQNGTGSLQFSTSLQSGFYVLEVRSGTSSSRGNFQATLSAPSLEVGAYAGGFISAGQTGYGAFFLPQSQDVTLTTVGQSLGDWGAPCLQMRLLDSSRNLIAPK